MVRRSHGEDGLVGHVEGLGHLSPNSLVVPVSSGDTAAI